MPIWFVVLFLAFGAFAIYRWRGAQGEFQVRPLTRVIAAIIIATAFVVLSLKIVVLNRLGGH